MEKEKRVQHKPHPGNSLESVQGGIPESSWSQDHGEPFPERSGLSREDCLLKVRGYQFFCFSKGERTALTSFHHLENVESGACFHGPEDSIERAENTSLSRLQGGSLLLPTPFRFLTRMRLNPH